MKYIKKIFILLLLVVVIAGISYYYLDTIKKNNFTKTAEVPVQRANFTKKTAMQLDTEILSPTFQVSLDGQSLYDLNSFIITKMNENKVGSGDLVKIILSKTQNLEKNSSGYGNVLHLIMYVIRVNGIDESLITVLESDAVLSSLYKKSLNDLGVSTFSDKKEFSFILQMNIGEYILKNTSFKSRYVVSRVIAGMSLLNYINNSKLNDQKQISENNINTATKVLELVDMTEKAGWGWKILDNPEYEIITDYFMGFYSYIALTQLAKDVSPSIRLFEKATKFPTEEVGVIKDRKAYARLYLALVPFETTKEYESMQKKDADKLKLTALKSLLDVVFLSPDFTTGQEYASFREYIKSAYLGERSLSLDRVKPMLDFLVANDSEYKKIIQGL